VGTDRNLRILLYGEFAWDRLAASYKRAFEELGHQIIPFDEQTIREYLSPWLAHRVGHRATIGSLALRRAGSKRWNERLLKAFRETKPDLVLVLKGDFLMPETVRAIDERGTRVFILHPDNPFPPHNNNRPETLPTALECSVYLIWSRSLIGRLKSLGVKQVEYLPFAWDPHVFTARESWCEQKCDYDTVFIGGWDRERETWPLPDGQVLRSQDMGSRLLENADSTRQPIASMLAGQCHLGKRGEPRIAAVQDRHQHLSPPESARWCNHEDI